MPLGEEVIIERLGSLFEGQLRKTGPQIDSGEKGGLPKLS
jgi:hypothetical protein